jgi:hypothetical protein
MDGGRMSLIPVSDSFSVFDLRTELKLKLIQAHLHESQCIGLKGVHVRVRPSQKYVRWCWPSAMLCENLIDVGVW